MAPSLPDVAAGDDPDDRADDRPVLVADIGGTNTRVALARGTEILPDSTRRYRNADYPGLESLLRRYLAEFGRPDCAGACAAVAGPVREGVASMTNLDWTIERDTLSRAAGTDRVALLNDLQAQGHALGHIAPDALAPVLNGVAAGPNAAKLVIGVGTGFNVAPVYDTAAGRYVTPSEAGHADLPIRTAADMRLCHFLATAHGFPSVEDVLSGRGIEHLYAWLGTEAHDPREARAAEIMEAVAGGGDARAADAARIFVTFLGRVAGDLALIHLPFGGIYLSGGVARAFAPHLAGFGFAAAFRDKGRFAGFMGNFGVTVIEDDYAALTGCAVHLNRLSLAA